MNLQTGDLLQGAVGTYFTYVQIAPWQHAELKIRRDTDLYQRISMRNKGLLFL